MKTKGKACLLYTSYMCKRFSVMIISYDKMNQLRHVRFLKNKEGVLAHLSLIHI